MYRNKSMPPTVAALLILFSFQICQFVWGWQPHSLYPSSFPIRFVSLYGAGNHISDSSTSCPFIHRCHRSVVLLLLHQKVISYFLPSFCLFDSRAEQAKYDPTLSATSVWWGIYTRIFFRCKNIPTSGHIMPREHLQGVLWGFGWNLESFFSCNT